MFRKKNIHLGKNSSVIVNITLNILSLFILRQSISHETLFFFFFFPLQFFPTRPKEKNPSNTKFFCICFQDLFFFPGLLVSKHILGPKLGSV